MTSSAFLSVRSPRKAGCRISVSLVHSVNFTSPTSFGGATWSRSRPSLFRRKASCRCAEAHSFINRLQRRLVESSADMPSIGPAFLCFVAYRKHQRAKVLPRPARLLITDDHHLLLMHRLELQPLARSLARIIETRRALGDHAFFVRSLRLGELALTKFGDVLAVPPAATRARPSSILGGAEKHIGFMPFPDRTREHNAAELLVGADSESRCELAAAPYAGTTVGFALLYFPFANIRQCPWSKGGQRWMRRRIATVQGRRATRISASARRQRRAMSVLERFLQRNQITKARPLPLVHTTESYYLKKIVDTGAIKAQPCNVFTGEKLSYFFVG